MEATQGLGSDVRLPEQERTATAGLENLLGGPQRDITPERAAATLRECIDS